MTGAPPMTAEENINFDELIGDIMENPELLLSDKFTAEQILEIQKRLNPYAGIAAKKGTNPDFKKVAAVSYTNLREDYLRRLTMTSLVGFIYQMAHEWEVPEKQRKWVAPEKKLTADDTKPYDPSRLVEQLEAALVADDASFVAGWIGEAAVNRRRLLERAFPDPGALQRLSIHLPDRPGAFAEITQALGAERINIEDLELHHHSVERGGQLELIVAGETEARRAAEIVRGQGYDVVVLPVLEAL